MAVETQLLPPRYRSPRRLGRGAMGDIYLATDDLLGREVAVKVLADRYAADEGIRERFKRRRSPLHASRASPARSRSSTSATGKGGRSS